jgi:hypothetical protein
VQEPGSGKAYTASGTTLTLSAALVNGTDEMYCVFLGRAVATNKPGAGSVGTTELAADAVTEAKIADDAVESEHLNDNVISGQTELAVAPASTDELLISDGGTLKRIDVSLVGGDNSPIFHANKNDGNQTIANTTATKVTFVNEVFDASSAYDASNSKFVAPSAGKYFFYSAVKWNNDDRGIRVIYLYKNGSLQIELFDQDGHDQGSQMASCGAILDLSASDYVEVYCYQSTADPENIVSSTTGTYFGGYKLI